MQIWLADFSFETTLKYPRTVKDIVVSRIPSDHINKHSDYLFRALREISDTTKATLIKDKQKHYKVKVTYTKFIGHGRSTKFSY